LILEGKVRIGGERHIKAGELVAADAELEVEGEQRYVSRGGVKLEHALDEFCWSPASLRCLDVGASTGGFTDCLLQRCAASVTAVDVGYGQLAWKLRNDPRVTVVERCNFRNASVEQLNGPFQFATADVSFISLAAIAPALAVMLAPGARSVVLVKPQFEAGRRWVRRGGVVRDPHGQVEAIESAARAFAGAGLAPRYLTSSPLRGPAGNIEFLLGLTRSTQAKLESEDAWADLDVAGVVRKAHETLSQ